MVYSIVVVIVTESYFFNHYNNLIIVFFCSSMFLLYNIRVFSFLYTFFVLFEKLKIRTQLIRKAQKNRKSYQHLKFIYSHFSFFLMALFSK